MVNLSTRAAVAAAGLATAAGVAAAPLAFAADELPVDLQVVQVKVDKACGTVTVTLDNKDTGEYGFVWSTVPGNGGSAGVKTGLISVASNKKVSQTIRFDEDSYAGVGAFTLGVSYGPNTHKQKFVDIYPVDTDCLPPTTGTPAPTTTAAPTTTPAPSTTPAPDDTFYASCDAVRDAGKAPLGRSEPGYRDALDSDGDGLACEVVEGVPAAPGAVLVPSQIDTGKP